MNISILKDILNKPQDQRDPQDLKKISAVISNIKFFQSLKENQSIFKECCMYLTYEHFNTGEFIFSEGEVGDKFYIIIKGQAGVWVKVKEKETFVKKEVLVYNDGGSFGELALVDQKPRAASIIAKSECHVAVLDKSNYNRILSSVMKKKRAELVEFLQKQALFQKWTKGSLLKLSYCFEEKTFNKGKVLFVEGQKVDFLYLIREGEVKISRNIRIDLMEDGQPITKKTVFLKRYFQHKADISILGTGELVGTYDIVNGCYSVTCKCLTETVRLLIISAGDFKKRVNQDESLNFLKSGKILKESIHESSIKSIRKIAKDRIVSPFKNIFLEETLNKVTENKSRVSKSLLKRESGLNKTIAKDLETHRNSLYNLTSSMALSFDNTDVPSRNKKPLLEESVKKRVQTAFTKSRTKYSKRPNSSICAHESETLQRRFKTPQNKSCESKSRIDHGEFFSIIPVKKSIKLLLNKIMPFGRIKPLKLIEKTEGFVNIHVQKKRMLQKNRNPANMSFRSFNHSQKLESKGCNSVD